MNDSRKTKAQLVQELQELRQRLAETKTASERPILGPEQVERFAAHGAWIVDTDFVVRVANEAMCRVLDKTPDEVVGAKCYELISGPGCHTEACCMRRAFADSSCVVAHQKRTPIGRAPLTCRVVAHLIQDRGEEPVGIVEHLEQAEGVSLPSPPPTVVREPDRSTSESGAKLAEVVLNVAQSLRSRLPDDAQSDLDVLEEACAPWSGPRLRSKSTPRQHSKPDLHEVGPHRSVLIVAPPTSMIRGAWADVVRRAGYALLNGDARASVDSVELDPTVAILDLALGEPVTDDLHSRLRQDYPNMPILVVSSSTSDALEARRWRRACTWYVPRAAGGDELVRLIEDVSPRPVLRSRPEH